MPDITLPQRSKFTIYHGFILSLALHLALGLPFVVHMLVSQPDDSETLVVELQGAVADSQTEQKVQQETKGAASPKDTQTAQEAKKPPPPAPPPEEPPPDAVAEERNMPPRPQEPQETPPLPEAEIKPAAPETKAAHTGATNVIGAEETQNAQTIRSDPQPDIERLKEYVKLLSKKVQANLVKQDQRKAAAVSFAILMNGQIRPESLKIVQSSGQSKLDASALQTIRSSVPFDPPPKELTVTIVVQFGNKQ